jgi:lysozyme
VTLFIPDVSNDNWGSETLTADGKEALMGFLMGLSGSYAGVEHKMSQGSDFTDPYGAICQTYCASKTFPFMGYHYATNDNPSAQAANWIASGGGPNAMIDFEQMTEDGVAMLTEPQFWSLVNAFNSAAVNVPLAYIPEWYADDIGMDLTPLAANGIQLISSAYALGYSQGPAKDIYRGCGGDTGEGWNAYRGGPVPTLWQFTSSAMVGTTKVDMNAYRGTKEQLVALYAAV